MCIRQPIVQSIALAVFFVATSMTSMTSIAAEVQDVLPLLQRFCVDCHGNQGDEVDLRFAQIAASQSSKATAAWHAIGRRIAAGEMPPEDAAQLSLEQRQRVLNWITETHGDPESVSPTDHWALSSPVRPAVPKINAPPHSQNPIDAFVWERLRHAGLKPSPAADRRTLLRRVTFDLTGLPPTLEQVREFIHDPDSLPVAYRRAVDRLLDSPHYGERWTQHWLDVIRWAESVGFETNAERQDAWHYRDWLIRSFNDDIPYDQFVRAQIIGDRTGDDAALGFLVAGPANLPGQIGRDEEAMRQARQDELDEVIRTVSQSLFGLTIGCARCHDHKFDPISQRDYYSMQAIFAGLRYGYRRLRGPINDAWTMQIPAAEQRLATLKKELESRRKAHRLRPPLANVQNETLAAVEVRSVRMEITATNGRSPSLYEFEVWTEPGGQAASRNVALASAGATPSASSFALANQTRHFDNLIDGSIDRRQAFPWVAANNGPAWIQIDFPKSVTIDRLTWHSGSSVPIDYQIKVRNGDTDQWSVVAHTRDRLPRADDPRDPDAVTLESVPADAVAEIFDVVGKIRKQQAELNRLRAGPQTYAASFSDAPADTRRLRRGDPMQPAEPVDPVVPAVLRNERSSNAPNDEFQRRQRLAEHLTQPDHPLTARVMVNRIWQHHFGTGIVETSSDFGRMGAEPSHPKLLDWLALELVDNQWSMKHLHRLIVTSTTYMQSSEPRREAFAVDADCRLLWRYPPRRLDAEAIRDSILLISGKLNRQMYGRGFDFFNRRGGLSDYTPKETFDADGWRRMIYAHKIRMQAVDVFGSFDCPDAGQMTPRRNRSITPIQSLGLFNSPFVVRQAEFFAQRLQSRSSGDLDAAVELAFEMALSRPPTREEASALISLAREAGLGQVCRVIFNTSEFVYVN